MTKRPRKRRPTTGQQQAAADLKTLAEQHPAGILAVSEAGVDDFDYLNVEITVSTSHLTVAPGGMPLEPTEDLVVKIPTTFPFSPPKTVVTHQRFVGYPHVLFGHELCVYLDGTREWHPGFGVTDYMNRLDRFLTDAAAGAFDPATALYHAVGGVPHHTNDTPTVVVRDFPDGDGKPFAWVGLERRTADRIDLSADVQRRDGVVPALLIRPQGSMGLGAGVNVHGLLATIDRTGHPRGDAVLAKLGQAARRAGPDERTWFVLAVPGPESRHGGATDHLLVGRLPLAASRRLHEAASAAGPAYTPDEHDLPSDTPVEWCYVSDERPRRTVRRDMTRPASGFNGKSVELWGCGALGSWIGELIVRAGAGSVTVRDFGQVSGGLLVRQNYTEADVGRSKAEALADRLRAIADGVVVRAAPGHALLALEANEFPDCDLIIDATVNTAVAVILDQIWRGSAHRPLIARVATDTPTSTLALVTICDPALAVGPLALDEAARDAAASDADLERFSVFWEDLDSAALVPAPGCSVPTFHGSAADACGVASTAVSLIAPHIAVGRSGSHFAALPIASGRGPAHRWVDALPA